MKFAVKVHNEFLSRAIQELAFKNGYKWYSSGQIYQERAPRYAQDEYIIVLDNDKDIVHGRVDILKSHTDYTLFDAKTDWDKIEQAMKPKEPRVIWVNEYKDGLEGICWEIEGNCKIDGEKNSTYIRTIKFQEVIE